MNEVELERLVVRLIGDGSSYQSMMQQAGKAAEQGAEQAKKAAITLEAVQSRLEGVGSAFLKAASAVGISVGFWSAFQAFEDMERSVIKMNSAIQQNGGDVAQVTAQYLEFAKSIQATTTLGKGQIMGLLSQAETMGFTGDIAQRLVTQSIGLAGATDMTEQHAMTLAIALERGNVQMLRRVPQLRGIHSETELVTRAQELMNIGLRNQEAFANTTSGKIQKLQNSMKGLTKEVGALISDAIRPAVEWLQSAADWFNKLEPAAKQAITWALGIAAALVMIGPAMTALAPIMTALKTGLLLPFKALFGIFSLFTVKIALIVLVVGLVVQAFGGFEVVFANLKTWGMEAFVAIEFGFSHFGQVAEFVWTSIKLGALVVWESLKHFFSVTAPEMWSNFVIGWMTFWTNAYNWTMTVMGNLGSNIVSIFSNLPGLITGAVRWDQVWRPLTDGFTEAVSEFPNMTALQIGEVEAQLTEEWQRQGQALGASFQEFRARRLAEMGRARTEAERGGMAIGDAMGKGLHKETSKIQAALSGSAEALSRMAAMKDRLEGKGGGGGGGPITPIAPRAPGGLLGGLGGILGNLDNFFRPIADAFENGWNATCEFFRNTWTNVLSFFQGTWETLWNSFPDVWTELMTEILDGIHRMTGGAIGVARAQGPNAINPETLGRNRLAQTAIQFQQTLENWDTRLQNPLTILDANIHSGLSNVTREEFENLLDRRRSIEDAPTTQEAQRLFREMNQYLAQIARRPGANIVNLDLP